MAAKGLAPIRVPEVGLNNVGSYQVSGRPFASTQTAGSAAEVAFPMVSTWFQVINRSVKPIRVGFSAVGVSGSNYFTVPESGSVTGYGKSDIFRMKVSGIWIYAPAAGTNGPVDVVAGLTCIDRKKTAGRLGPSWSGSAGVG